jgi:uncharacterized protein
MSRRACDGAGLLGAFRAAVANLEAHVEEINALNVFPVPDGDTGSNMLATVKAALAEAEALGPTGTADRIAAAAAFGALMGARGNSGVITSQILRGVSEGLSGKARFNALDLANALDAGTKAAYSAVAKPVEGTILTVVREASRAAVASAERERDLEVVLGATLDAAHAAVAKTPSLLAILKEAGVVDSGGQGLYRLVQGTFEFARSRTARAVAAADAHGSRTASGATEPSIGGGLPAPSVLVAGIDDGFGYETMYLAQARPGSPIDVDAVRRHLESIGESVLVAGDASAIKVHVHSERPDEVITYGLGLGALSRISVENLDHQARDVRESKAAAFAGGADAGTANVDASNGSAGDLNGSAGGVNGSAGGASGSYAPIGAAIEELPLAVVAVAAGEGLAAIFRDFGVQRVVLGGQAANPSTGELLEAIRSVAAKEVLVLPNNPNVILAARQVADLADRPVAVVATRNAAEGFAALLALDPTRGAAENAPQMTEAGRGVQTLSVTSAVRDATIGGTAVRAGQWIALDPDDGLVAVHHDADEAALAALGSLQPGYELLTIYYGADGELAGTEALARRMRSVAPTAEIEVVHGGQPHYRYLISAE